MRETQLDGLRGLAAAGVALYHAWSFAPPPADAVAWLAWSPAYLFMNGRIFVVLFFVLSGYVLARALSGDDGDARPLAYAARRVFRIYPPYAAAALLAVLLAPGAPSAGALIGHLMMSGRQGDVALNPVAWSLIYELRITLFMPLILLAVRLNALAAATLSMAAALAATFALQTLAPSDGSPDRESLRAFETVGGSLLATLYFVPMFVVGAALAVRGEAVARWVSGLSVPAAGALLCAACLLMWTGLDGPGTLGACGLIALLARPGAVRSFLTRPAPQWLGAVSYSLYLTHLPVLAATLAFIGPQVGAGAASLIGLAVALPVAAAFHRLVERPSQKMSRRATAPRPAVSPAR